MLLAVGQEDVCGFIRKALADLTPVRSVHSASEALKSFLLPADCPPLAMIDLALPDGSGLDLADNISAVAPDTRVLLYGAEPTVDQLARALNSGYAGFMSLPLQPVQLQSRIGLLLETTSLPHSDTLIRHLRKNLLEQTEMLYQTRRAGLLALARLAEHRDTDTGMHVERVSEFSVALTKRLREAGLHRDVLTDEFIASIGIASALHDIGKVAIPDTILHKPSALSPDEFELMKTHCMKGWEVIQAGKAETGAHGVEMAMAADVIRYHHERWDGGGYPDGLKGEAIPLAARIVAVIDAYDAMRSQRSYNPQRAQDDTVAEIRRCVGAQFDPEIATVFLKHADEIETIGNTIDRITARWK